MEHLEGQPAYTSTTLSGQELYKRIRPDGNSDPRFLPRDEGGVFHYSPLDEFSDIHKEGVTYSVVEEAGKIVAIVETQENPYDASEIWLKSISVDTNLKGTGLSEKVLRETFSYIKRTGKKLKLSSYTDEGQERLPRRIEALANEFGVEIVPADR